VTVDTSRSGRSGRDAREGNHSDDAEASGKNKDFLQCVKSGTSHDSLLSFCAPEKVRLSWEFLKTAI
jgi:hypothetical protein